ncbi:hypothetical protein EDD15DRAFT_1481269 [Pisolithus albus]|nr:hypothetical protein EDD15DRAFT_1481269 [Pisolithus albus]
MTLNLRLCSCTTLPVCACKCISLHRFGSHAFRFRIFKRPFKEPQRRPQLGLAMQKLRVGSGISGTNRRSPPYCHPSILPPAPNINPSIFMRALIITPAKDLDIARLHTALTAMAEGHFQSIAIHTAISFPVTNASGKHDGYSMRLQSSQCAVDLHTERSRLESSQYHLLFFLLKVFPTRTSTGTVVPNFRP